jgi:hypothetical protein
MLDGMVVWTSSSFASRVVSVALIIGSSGCSQKSDDAGETSLKGARHIIVEIDAMPGATPSFAPLDRGVSPWVILELNLRALAPPDIEQLSYPSSEADVGSIDAAAGREFKDDEIHELARRHRDFEPKGDEAHFHVLFLDGEYGENTQQIRVRALNIGGSRTIAVFGAVSSYASDFERITEQSAILHELGHAFGLVNLTMPDVSGHSDPESPQHCTEFDCVMGPFSIFPSQARHFQQGGPVPLLFGPQCLRDVAAYYE